MEQNSFSLDRNRKRISAESDDASDYVRLHPSAISFNPTLYTIASVASPQSPSKEPLRLYQRAITLHQHLLHHVVLHELVCLSVQHHSRRPATQTRTIPCLLARSSLTRTSLLIQTIRAMWLKFLAGSPD